MYLCIRTCMHTYVHTQNYLFSSTLWVFCCLIFTVDLIMYLAVLTSTLNCKPTLLTRVTCLFFTSHVMHKPPAIQLMPATNLFKPVSHPSSNTLFTTDHLGTMQEHYNPCIRCTHCTSPCSQQLCTQSSCKKTVPIHLWLSILWWLKLWTKLRIHGG